MSRYRRSNDLAVISHLKSSRAVRGNLSGLAILLSNAFVCGLAVLEDWDLRPLLVIYWAQSVIIGILKTGADWLMHCVEHRVLQRRAREEPAEVDGAESG